MDPKPYIPGMRPADPGPLSRFTPPLEDGVIARWLPSHAPPFDKAQGKAGSWLLDPFGFSPRLVLEAARAGYRVLVTVNNPITRFLLEMAAEPPSEADFQAALAELGIAKKGEERLAAHLQSLYLTRCEKCGQQTQADSFLWRRSEEVPYGRIYTCPHCGDSGVRPVTREDVARVKNIAATDAQATVLDW
jgi:DNA-directed RNA polymerase subunit M/transcription elongation factor TFIIS